jgi:hypothetical protein
MFTFSETSLTASEGSVSILILIQVFDSLLQNKVDSRLFSGKN